MKQLVNFSKMVKLSHTLFGLPFALVAVATVAWQGEVKIGLREFLYIVGAFTAVRSFSMAFNRIADAVIDKKNPRTKNREIPAGVLSVQTVWWFAGVSLAAAWVFAWLLDPLAFYLSFPALVLLAGYSYAKRFTWLCHYWLGGVIGMVPLGVYIALTRSAPSVAWILSGTLALYIAGFDILYALQDREFDKHEGLHSVPVRFGVEGALRISALTHLFSLAGFIWLGFPAKLGAIYFAGAAVIGGLMLGEHLIVGWGKKVRLENIPVAFFHFNSAVSVLFLAFVAIDYYVQIIAR